MKKSTKYENLISQIRQSNLLFDEPLAKYTTIKIGGPADVFYNAQNTFDFLNIITVCRELKIPFFILGGGSNLIISDDGFRGVAIKNSNSIVQRIDDKRVAVGSGTQNGELIKNLVKFELSGLEFLAGIPGTIGGAIKKNARFRHPGNQKNQLTHDFIEKVLILTSDNKLKWIDKSQIKAENKAIIVAVLFKLKKSSSELIKTSIKEQLTWRATETSKQPSLPSPGCIFSNPSDKNNYPAGKMIDLCGLIGTRIGDVEISKDHANWIVNLGNGKASDVMAIIEICRKEVKRKFGVELELEVDVV
ncbi:UDP-N-acetylmuramate dehydrogenase [bacterium]|nr:MAG: UDP-N-acetylmuramate dehydrogenase [bacterium]